MSMKRFKLAMLMGFLVSLSMTLVGCPTGGVLVIFPDDSLDGAIRDALRKPFGPITSADLLTLNSLDASNLGVTDLRGLEGALNLTSLDVSQPAPTTDGVRNLDPIKDLVNLRFLDLSNNDITDVSPVAGLFNLDELFLGGNPVFNISAIVANADNGGLGGGDTVTLTQSTLLDEEGNTSQVIADQLNRLVDLGIDVVLLTF